MDDSELKDWPQEWRDELFKLFGTGKTVKMMMAVAQLFKAIKDKDTQAHNAAWDRREGKAEQPIDHGGDAPPQQADPLTLARQVAFLLQQGVASQPDATAPKPEAEIKP